MLYYLLPWGGETSEGFNVLKFSDCKKFLFWCNFWKNFVCTLYNVAKNLCRGLKVCLFPTEFPSWSPMVTVRAQKIQWRIGMLKNLCPALNIMARFLWLVGKSANHHWSSQRTTLPQMKLKLENSNIWRYFSIILYLVWLFYIVRVILESYYNFIIYKIYPDKILRGW